MLQASSFRNVYIEMEKIERAFTKSKVAKPRCKYATLKMLF